MGCLDGVAVEDGDDRAGEVSDKNGADENNLYKPAPESNHRESCSQTSQTVASGLSSGLRRDRIRGRHLSHEMADASSLGTFVTCT